MRDNSVDRDKDVYDSVYVASKPIGDSIRIRDTRAYKSTGGETIKSDSLVVRYCACSKCLEEFVKNILKQRANPKANQVQTTLEGICADLDQVYLGWLQSGKEKILRLSCAHTPEICQYLKGKAVVDLGIQSTKKSFDYNNVFVSIELSDANKDHLIKRYLS